MCFRWKKTVTLACVQKFVDCFLSIGVMIGTAKLNILITVWMTMTFIHGHSCMRNQKLLCPFLGKFAVGMDDIQYVVTTCWLLKRMLSFNLHKYYSKERTLLT